VSRAASRPTSRVLSLPLPFLLFVIAAVLRLLCFAAFYMGSVVTGHQGIVDPFDSVEYDRWAWFAAEYFRAGQWVDLRLQWLEGTTDVGFTYLVALQYTIVGHHPEVPRVVNCLLAALTAPAAYIAARRANLGEATAARAGWLVACWPLSIYWAGLDLLKDPLIWCFVVLGLLALVARTVPGRSVLSTLGVGGAYVTRNYMGPGLAILLAIGAVVKKDWRGLAGLLAGLVILQAALLVTGFPGLAAFNVLDSSGQVAPGNGPASLVCSPAHALVGGGDCAPPISANPKDLLLRFAIGVPTELYGPGLKPLTDLGHPTLDWGMYPGLLAWAALIPFTALGLWRAVRRRDRTLWSVAILALGIWAALALIYAGHALRQREMAFPATLIFTALGLERPLPRRWWWPVYAAYWVVIVVGLGWEAALA